MNPIDKLSELFGRFPGIGPRQAKRFVYFLLSRNGDYSGELIKSIQELKREITQCSECMKFFVHPHHGRTAKICSICSDEARDGSMLMLVPRDIDLEAVEKSGSYRGRYFVLGGVVPILEKEPEKRIRLKELGKILEKRKKELKEIILAMNANLDGENTAEFLKQFLKQRQGETLTISLLGRGISECADTEDVDLDTH